ncbi:hypothetical protein LPJ73_007778, partial [Coemansia sp. RSA 2703]
HSATFDLSSSTRAGSTDSAPDFLPRRSMGGGAMPTPGSDTFALSEPMAESGDGLGNYSLHAAGSSSGGSSGDAGFAAQQKHGGLGAHTPTSESGAQMMVGVPSPPHSQRSATATST